MRNSLGSYLDDQISKFIDASIARAAVSKSTVYRYRLTPNDIKKSVPNVQRIHGETIIKYVEAHDVACTVDVISHAFFVEVDLLKCVLTPRQAEDFKNACSK